MVFTASVVYIDEKRSSYALEFLQSIKNVEIYEKDLSKGKIVIVIEAEDNIETEKIEKIIRENDVVIDIDHYAFHFEEEVDALISGEKKPDINFEEIFKKKRKLQ